MANDTVQIESLKEEVKSLTKEVQSLRAEIAQLKQGWQSLQETLYLLSIPGMRESIIEGLNTPVEECSEELDW